MESENNYGLILQHLRKDSGLSIQMLSKKIGKSAGWLCEVENNAGTSKLTENEFNRIVAHLGGVKHREMFRTWVANSKNAERIDRTFDGAVLKYIRIKKQLSLKDTANLVGLSNGYLSKIECGLKPISADMRKKLMVAYGYNPGSFKNLSTDPVRSKAVPVTYKLGILLSRLDKTQIDSLYHFARSLIESVGQNVSSSYLK